jgi:hypothetical protein
MYYVLYAIGDVIKNVLCIKGDRRCDQKMYYVLFAIGDKLLNNTSPIIHILMPLENL